MDPTFYHQWSPPTRHGGRAVPGIPLGLFLDIYNEPEVVKAVPIIGEKKAPTPALVSPKGESLAKPAVKTTDTRASAAPKILGPSGQQVFAGPKTPSPFVGGTGGSKQPSGPSSIITPGPTPKASGGLAATPHDKPFEPTPSIVGPSGKPVSSKITEGPGAARPDPKLAIPTSLAPKTPAGKVELTGAVGSGPKSTTTADEAQWSAAIGAAKQREATASKYAAERKSPLDFTPKTQAPAAKPKSKDVQATETAQALTAATTPGERKLMSQGGMKDPKATPEGGGLTPQQQQMMEAANAPAGGVAGGAARGGGGTERDGGGSPGRAGGGRGAKKPGKNPNITGWMSTGYAIGAANDPSATVSILGQRAGAMAQGALSEPGAHEAARQGREAHQQRQEMIRQQNQQTQSSLQASLTARNSGSQSPPVRSGLRQA